MRTQGAVHRGTSRTYLDTYYLLEVLFDGDYKQDVKRLFARIDSNAFEVFIPQIVLGEAVSQIFEKSATKTRAGRLMEMLARLMQEYKWGTANMPPPSNKSFRIMNELLLVDDRLAGVDVVILAQALADPDAKFLFTPDRILVKNENICDYELRLRQNGERNTKLKILERL